MRRWMLVSMSLALLAPIAALHAQRPVSVGLAGGASVPQGNLGDAVDLGWHGLATIGVGSLMQPLGIRLDVAYNRFAFKDDVSAALGAAGNYTVGSATLNASYRLPMTNSPLSPYLITGLGAYRSECSGDIDCDAVTRYGWNVGLGTKMYVLPVRTFLEARYHRTSRGGESVNYFPVTLGLMF